MEFDEAFKIVIGHEGGYVNDSNDPGGETKFGISKRSYPHENIRELTLDQAKQIYLRDYWNRCQCAQLPAMIRVHVFDAAVNSGTVQASKWLQRAVRADPDGVIGAQTVMACRMADPAVTVARISGLRLEFMAELRNWKHHGRGWTLRIARNLINI